MRAAIYARVSSAAQRDSHTIENQLRTLPAFVASQGWTIAGTYVDDGRSAKSGKLDKRDGFAQLVRDADARLFDVLVIADVDRLTRTDDLEERARILGPFQRNNIQIVTPSGGALDLRTMLGELYVTMQALVAAEENRKRAARIMAGKLRAIAEGRKPAGPTPFGLVYTRATGTWSLDPVRADIVREIFRRVIAGESCMVIADDLHARGAPSPRGPWERHKVWQIVRLRYAVGQWTADKVRRLEIAVPAIVSEAEWQAAQAKLAAHGKRGLRRTRHVYMLEGMAVCGLCGSPMAIRSATKSRHRGHLLPAAYVCRARKIARIGEGRCTAPIVAVADVDARLWAVIAAALNNPELAALVQRKSDARAANRRDWQADVGKFRAHLTRLAKTEAATLSRYRRGLVSDAAMDIEAAAARKERSAIEAQLERAEQCAAARADELEAAPLAWLDAIRDLAENLAPASRQRVVRAIVEAGAVFDGRDVRFTLLIDEGLPADQRAPSLVGSAGYRTSHETIVAIPLVA